MTSLNEYVCEYRKQIEKGDVRIAYQGLMEYLSGLRNYLENVYPEHSVSRLHQGYMDMSYFSFTPKSLSEKMLKVALVFVHEKASFEAWLVGVNKKVQKEYWKALSSCDDCGYRIPETTDGTVAILEYDLEIHPDYDDLETLTDRIEGDLLRFIEGVERVVCQCPVKGHNEDMQRGS